MTLLMALLYTETNSQLGNSLDGVLPEHTHDIYLNIGTVKSGSIAGNISNDKVPKSTHRSSKGTSSVTGITVGDTLRPPSVGVCMWKRTA